MKRCDGNLAFKIEICGDVLIPYFTLAIRIEIQQSLRIERLIQREKESFGSKIEIGGDMY